MKIIGSESKQGIDWSNQNTAVFDYGVEEWVEKFNQLDNVTVKYVKGDHHYFVEEKRAAETAQLITDFINSNWLNNTKHSTIV